MKSSVAHPLKRSTILSMTPRRRPRYSAAGTDSGITQGHPPAIFQAIVPVTPTSPTRMMMRKSRLICMCGGRSWGGRRAGFWGSLRQACASSDHTENLPDLRRIQPLVSLMLSSFSARGLMSALL